LNEHTLGTIVQYEEVVGTHPFSLRY
jgi:hypothetical protein